MRAIEEEEPSGLPEGHDDEETPLGVPANEDDSERDLPGFPEGDIDTAG